MFINSKNNRNNTWKFSIIKIRIKNFFSHHICFKGLNISPQDLVSKDVSIFSKFLAWRQCVGKTRTHLPDISPQRVHYRRHCARGPRRSAHKGVGERFCPMAHSLRHCLYLHIACAKTPKSPPLLGLHWLGGESALKISLGQMEFLFYFPFATFEIFNLECGLNVRNFKFPRKSNSWICRILVMLLVLEYLIILEDLR